MPQHSIIARNNMVKTNGGFGQYLQSKPKFGSIMIKNEKGPTSSAAKSYLF